MRGSHLQTNKNSRIFGRASITQKANKQQHSKRFRQQPIELKQTLAKRTVENATQTSPWRQKGSLSVSSQQETALEFEESSSLDSDINCKSDTLNDASMITEEIASEYAQDNHDNQNHPSREASRTQSAVKSLDIGARVVKFLSQKAEENTENKEASDVLQSHLISVNSSRMVTECSKEVSNSCLKSDNPDQSCQGLSLKASSRSSLKLEHKIPGKASDRSCKTSKSSRISKSQSINFVINDEKTLEHSNNVLTAGTCGEDMALSVEQTFRERISTEAKSLKESPKKISNIKDSNTIHIEKSECLENAKSEDIPESQKETPNIQQEKSKCVENINDSQKEIQSSSTPTSSENETTHVPLDSSSSSKISEAEDESEYSSIKENDNTSPDYSSHWTEEITSEELSDEELDNSFREKFTVYKKSLLEEDDGIVASDEDEISICENETLETVGGKEFDIKRYAQSVLEKEDIGQFKQLIQSEKNFLNYENEDGYNLLHLTASNGLDNFVKALLQVGFPLEAVTKKGLTALKLAVFNGHPKCCNLLLQNGASLTKENGDFDTGIFEFSGELHPTMKILLEEYGENLNKVQKLCEIFNKTGNREKKMSKKLSQSLLSALADLTFDENSQQD